MRKVPQNLRITELRKRKQEVLQGGGSERITKQHAKGKLTARERIERLLDAGFIDDIIEPMETRPKIIAALAGIRFKKIERDVKKHGNMPV